MNSRFHFLFVTWNRRMPVRVYKNFQIDMRQYKNLEMFMHAESLVNRPALAGRRIGGFSYELVQILPITFTR